MTTTAPVLCARAHIHAALEQQIAHGAILLDDAVTAVAASLGEDQAVVVFALGDLLDLGSIVHSADGRLRPTYRMHTA